MTLVKLDSGDYINTEFVTYIGVKQVFKFAAHGKLDKLRDDGFRVHMANDPENYFDITKADRDRIVKVMSWTAVTLPLFHHQDGLKPFSDDDFKISDKS